MVAKVANWVTFETTRDWKIGARDMSPIGRLLISFATTLGDFLLQPHTLLNIWEMCHSY